MDVFKEMWIELAQRLQLDHEHAFNKQITSNMVLRVMVEIENLHGEELKALQDLEIQEAIQKNKENDDNKKS